MQMALVQDAVRVFEVMYCWTCPLGYEGRVFEVEVDVYMDGNGYYVRAEDEDEFH